MMSMNITAKNIPLQNSKMTNLKKIFKKMNKNIKKVISNKDYFYRYGGDEFILITRKDKESIRFLNKWFCFSIFTT